MTLRCNADTMVRLTSPARNPRVWCTLQQPFRSWSSLARVGVATSRESSPTPNPPPRPAPSPLLSTSPCDVSTLFYRQLQFHVVHSLGEVSSVATPPGAVEGLSWLPSQSSARVANAWRKGDKVVRSSKAASLLFSPPFIKGIFRRHAELLHYFLSCSPSLPAPSDAGEACGRLAVEWYAQTCAQLWSRIQGEAAVLFEWWYASAAVREQQKPDTPKSNRRSSKGLVQLWSQRYEAKEVHSLCVLYTASSRAAGGFPLLSTELNRAEQGRCPMRVAWLALHWLASMERRGEGQPALLQEQAKGVSQCRPARLLLLLDRVIQASNSSTMNLRSALPLQFYRFTLHREGADVNLCGGTAALARWIRWSGDEFCALPANMRFVIPSSCCASARAAEERLWPYYGEMLRMCHRWASSPSSSQSTGSSAIHSESCFPLYWQHVFAMYEELLSGACQCAASAPTIASEALRGTMHAAVGVLLVLRRMVSSQKVSRRSKQSELRPSSSVYIEPLLEWHRQFSDWTAEGEEGTRRGQGWGTWKRLLCQGRGPLVSAAASLPPSARSMVSLEVTLWREAVKTDAYLLLAMGHASEHAADLYEWSLVPEGEGEAKHSKWQRGLLQALALISDCANHLEILTQIESHHTKEGDASSSGSRVAAVLGKYTDKDTARGMRLRLEEAIRVAAKLLLRFSARESCRPLIREGLMTWWTGDASGGTSSVVPLFLLESLDAATLLGRLGLWRCSLQCCEALLRKGMSLESGSVGTAVRHLVLSLPFQDQLLRSIENATTEVFMEYLPRGSGLEALQQWKPCWDSFLEARLAVCEGVASVAVLKDRMWAGVVKVVQQAMTDQSLSQRCVWTEAAVSLLEPSSPSSRSPLLLCTLSLMLKLVEECCATDEKGVPPESTRLCERVAVLVSGVAWSSPSLPVLHTCLLYWLKDEDVKAAHTRPVPSSPTVPLTPHYQWRQSLRRRALLPSDKVRRLPCRGASLECENALVCLQQDQPRPPLSVAVTLGQELALRTVSLLYRFACVSGTAPEAALIRLSLGVRPFEWRGLEQLIEFQRRGFLQDETVCYADPLGETTTLVGAKGSQVALLCERVKFRKLRHFLSQMSTADSFEVVFYRGLLSELRREEARVSVAAEVALAGCVKQLQGESLVFPSDEASASSSSPSALQTAHRLGFLFDVSPWLCPYCLCWNAGAAGDQERCARCKTSVGGWLLCRCCASLTAVPRTLQEWRALAVEAMVVKPRSDNQKDDTRPCLEVRCCGCSAVLGRVGCLASSVDDEADSFHTSPAFTLCRESCSSSGDGVALCVIQKAVARLWWWTAWRCGLCHHLNYSRAGAGLHGWALPPSRDCVKCGALAPVPLLEGLDVVPRCEVDLSSLAYECTLLSSTIPSVSLPPVSCSHCGAVSQGGGKRPWCAICGAALVYSSSTTPPPQRCEWCCVECETFNPGCAHVCRTCGGHSRTASLIAAAATRREGGDRRFLPVLPEYCSTCNAKLTESRLVGRCWQCGALTGTSARIQEGDDSAPVYEGPAPPPCFVYGPLLVPSAWQSVLLTQLAAQQNSAGVLKLLLCAEQDAANSESSGPAFLPLSADTSDDPFVQQIGCTMLQTCTDSATGAFKCRRCEAVNAEVLSGAEGAVRFAFVRCCERCGWCEGIEGASELSYDKSMVAGHGVELLVAALSPEVDPSSPRVLTRVVSLLLLIQERRFLPGAVQWTTPPSLFPVEVAQHIFQRLLWCVRFSRDTEEREAEKTASSGELRAAWLGAAVAWAELVGSTTELDELGFDDLTILAVEWFHFYHSSSASPLLPSATGVSRPRSLKYALEELRGAYLSSFQLSAKQMAEAVKPQQSSQELPSNRPHHEQTLRPKSNRNRREKKQRGGSVELPHKSIVYPSVRWRRGKAVQSSQRRVS